MAGLVKQESLFGDGRQSADGEKAKRKTRAKKQTASFGPTVKTFVFPCGHKLQRVTSRRSMQVLNPAGRECLNCTHEDIVQMANGKLCSGRVDDAKQC